MLKVTRIKVDKLSPKESGICGEFTIYLNDELCIHKVYVINGNSGLFIAFPNTGEMRLYKKSKRFFDIVHPVNKSLREHIEHEVLSRYNEEIVNLNKDF